MSSSELHFPTSKYVDAWLECRANRGDSLRCTRATGRQGCPCEISIDPGDLTSINLSYENKVLNDVISRLRRRESGTYELIYFTVWIRYGSNSPPHRRIVASRPTFEQACDAALQRHKTLRERRLRTGEECRMREVWVGCQISPQHTFALPRIFSNYNCEVVEAHWGQSGTEGGFRALCQFALEDYIHRLKEAHRERVGVILRDVFTWRLRRAFIKCVDPKRRSPFAAAASAQAISDDPFLFAISI